MTIQNNFNRELLQIDGREVRKNGIWKTAASHTINWFDSKEEI